MRAGLLFLLAALVTAPAAGQVARENYGALLEPSDVIMHGAGQSDDAFEDYWNVMPDDGQPVAYMYYMGVNNLTADWSDDLKEQLLKYEAQGRFVIPQIGLSMTSDGNPSAHYEGQVANGSMDDRIANLVEGFKKLGFPAYLRIGYEFNGRAWNGYLPDTYRQAFVRITEALREADVEVATVWCVSVDGDDNYYDFYPGDEYVDWWGIDIFSVEHFADANGLAFMDSARVHQKPVMLGETTPRYVGVTDASDFNAWFEPFFEWMDGQAGMKLFSYINWDWAEWSSRLGTNWHDWGDARLDQSPLVRAPYTARLEQDIYLHAEDEYAFRQRLGYDDTTPPPAVGGLSSSSTGSGISLSWSPSEDPSGIAHYLIYRDGVRVDRTLHNPYTDPAAKVGTTVYQISAVDRAGNQAPLSAEVEVTTGSIEHIDNGEFDDGTSAWLMEVYDAGASASVSVDSGSRLSGETSARVTIFSSTGTNWHIQFRQFLNMSEGDRYTIRFQASANVDSTIPVVVQEVASPFSIYFMENVSVTGTGQTYEKSFVAPTSNRVALSFFLGTVSPGRYWFDGVSVVASTPGVTSAEAQPELPGRMLLGAAYPNPGSGSASMPVDLERAGTLSMRVTDLQGRQVSGQDLGVRPAGQHVIAVDLNGLPSGTYLVTLVADGTRETRSLVLIAD